MCITIIHKCIKSYQNKESYPKVTIPHELLFKHNTISFEVYTNNVSVIVRNASLCK